MARLPFKDSVMNAIDVNVVSEIQKDLKPYDIRSLVFILYEIPDTALEGLARLLLVTKDIELLRDWAVSSHSQPAWRFMFLEALAVCQLYGVIKKLGIDVAAVKAYYTPDNINSSLYIHRTKKMLYKLCENVTSESLSKLKKTLLSYDINVSKHESCELVLLELLKKKFITLKETGRLTRIIEQIPALNNFTKQINVEFSQDTTNSSNSVTEEKPSHSTPKENDDVKVFTDNFNETFEMLSNMLENNLTLKNLQADHCRRLDAYEIKNKERIGVAYIINQENFHPTKESIENRSFSKPLHDREGSTKDKKFLEHVLKTLKFVVYTDDNLDSNKMKRKITEIVRNNVQKDDSVFMLCILSHGVRGHVYAADCIPVKVEEIQYLIDKVSDSDGCKLGGMPKVILIQACQVDEDNQCALVADGPPQSNYFLRKSDYLVCWATAPQYEAFRDLKKGSIFILFFCYLLWTRAKYESLQDICTAVIRLVSEKCTELQKQQLPIFESTLMKKLFLHTPNL